MSFSSPIFSLFTHQPTPSFSLPIITNLPYPYHLRPFLALLLITIFFTFSLTLFTNIFFFSLFLSSPNFIFLSFFFLSLAYPHHQFFSHSFTLERLPSKIDLIASTKKQITKALNLECLRESTSTLSFPFFFPFWTDKHSKASDAIFRGVFAETWNLSLADFV